MAEAQNNYQCIYQNLIDAGFDTDNADKCIVLYQNRKTNEMLSILQRHRKSLIETVHTGQRKIDCLDYLIYSLK